MKCNDKTQENVCFLIAMNLKLKDIILLQQEFHFYSNIFNFVKCVAIFEYRVVKNNELCEEPCTVCLLWSFPQTILIIWRQLNIHFCGLNIHSNLRIFSRHSLLALHPWRKTFLHLGTLNPEVIASGNWDIIMFKNMKSRAFILLCSTVL